MTEDREWLIRAFDLVTNVRWLVMHGRSEKAVAEVDEFLAAWRARPVGSYRDRPSGGWEYKP